MNINNISEGQIFKNYKALCESLGEPIKTGKAKQLQLSDWNRYFEHHKSGHNFIINRILETPKEKVDNRVDGNNKVKYIDKIENLMLDLLAQNGNNGQVFLSKNKLLHSLQMVNANYSYGKSKPFKLVKLMNVTKQEVDDFYEVSDGMLKRNLEKALDNLRNKALITWKNSLTVCYVDTKVAVNEFNNVKAIKIESVDEDGDIAITFDAHKTEQSLIHRKATPEEEQLIIRAERNVLNTFECENVSEVFKKNKSEQFYREVRDILFEQSNIYLYYTSYEIISNKDHILEELKSSERETVQNSLNNEIVEKVKLNTAYRYNRAFDKYDETHNPKYEMRMNELYVDNSYKLTDTLIKTGAASLRSLH